MVAPGAVATLAALFFKFEVVVDRRFEVRVAVEVGREFCVAAATDNATDITGRRRLFFGCCGSRRLRKKRHRRNKSR